MAAREKTDQVRQKIVKAADQMFYHKGYNLTSFSDIASASGVPRGNLNYYFKTKNEVLVAVIQRRVAEIQKMLKKWEQEYKTPLERLQRYAQIAVRVKNDVVQYGCPMGTLNLELGKTQHQLQRITKEQFVVFEQWLKKQFQAMGCGKNSEKLTLHLMVRTQGISSMAYIHKDKQLIQREVKSIIDWLTDIGAKQR